MVQSVFTIEKHNSEYVNLKCIFTIPISEYAFKICMFYIFVVSFQFEITFQDPHLKFSPVAIVWLEVSKKLKRIKWKLEDM